MTERIVLASQSPRRKQLLEWAEIDFDVILHPTDESYPPAMSIEEVPIHIARNKALAVQSKLSHERIILAADTIVVLKEKIIGKPVGYADAVRILESLSGKKHSVITGVVIRRAEKEITFADTTEVWFHHLDKKEIDYYVEKYKPFDKAGAYAIQEWIGVIGISRISGDFYNVMGLPVSKVVRELNKL